MSSDLFLPALISYCDQLDPALKPGVISARRRISGKLSDRYAERVGLVFGLNVAQKVLAVLFGGLLLFSVTYLITSGVLWLLFADPEESAPADGGSCPQKASVPDE